LVSAPGVDPKGDGQEARRNPMDGRERRFYMNVHAATKSSGVILVNAPGVDPKGDGQEARRNPMDGRERRLYADVRQFGPVPEQ